MLKRVFSVIIILIAAVGISAAKDGFFKFHSLRFQFTTGYDGNILRYSERDINRFVESDEYHPSRLSTYDDWTNEFRLKAYFRGPKIFGKRLRISYFAKLSSFYRNPFNNYNNHTLLVSQEIGERLRFHFKYFYMPEYYLREYRDRDLNRYESCSFEDHQVRPGMTFEIIRNTNLTFQVEYEQIYYNKYFTEYDCESWLYEWEISRSFGRNLTINLRYGFRVSDNVGYRAAVIAGSNPLQEEDTEYGDSSYEADIFQVGASYRLRRLWGRDTDFSLQYKLRKRYYTTCNPVENDPFHSGRADSRQRIIASAARGILPAVEAAISYTYEWRRTDSPVSLVRDIKEFDQNVWELSLTYKFF